ncbi:hypothetical protein TCELL_0114 [Thermogladius calderae 1633]|uniref:Uncharacterized protein n=1 Tax=Thermogladius calderae (strain DSM 22663 / VKM B-2946 / 1633) TaxID=1184251 RepID=I3TCQ1_THEC1|nr:hypothetical protein TCELL_0114 [Thermogladius calderae 1633]
MVENVSSNRPFSWTASMAVVLYSSASPRPTTSLYELVLTPSAIF